MLDSYRHRGLRKQLVDSLCQKGISDNNVLEAIYAVPRHLFLDKALEEEAYKDKALPIADGQTISQPYTVAYQTTLLDLQVTDKVLEIGTGSGYQASVLTHLCKKVYSIERHESLHLKTQKLLSTIGYGSVRTLLGDGYLGAPRFAPYDKIIITAGATFIPSPLVEQLKVGGYMVIPIGDGDAKTMKRIIKTGEHTTEEESYGQFRFVPFLEGVKRR